mgnify:CR=1 FL=1
MCDKIEFETKNSNDVFESFVAQIGCEYVSDMRFEPYNTVAKSLLRAAVVEKKYALCDISALYDYLYGRHIEFSDYAEAEKATEGEEKGA